MRARSFSKLFVVSTGALVLYAFDNPFMNDCLEPFEPFPTLFCEEIKFLVSFFLFRFYSIQKHLHFDLFTPFTSYDQCSKKAFKPTKLFRSKMVPFYPFFLTLQLSLDFSLLCPFSLSIFNIDTNYQTP